MSAYLLVLKDSYRSIPHETYIHPSEKYPQVSAHYSINTSPKSQNLSLISSKVSNRIPKSGMGAVPCITNPSWGKILYGPVRLDSKFCASKVQWWDRHSSNCYRHFHLKREKMKSKGVTSQSLIKST